MRPLIPAFSRRRFCISNQRKTIRALQHMQDGLQTVQPSDKLCPATSTTQIVPGQKGKVGPPSRGFRDVGTFLSIKIIPVLPQPERLIFRAQCLPAH